MSLFERRKKTIKYRFDGNEKITRIERDGFKNTWKHCMLFKGIKCSRDV